MLVLINVFLVDLLNMQGGTRKPFIGTYGPSNAMTRKINMRLPSQIIFFLFIKVYIYIMLNILIFHFSFIPNSMINIALMHRIRVAKLSIENFFLPLTHPLSYI